MHPRHFLDLNVVLYLLIAAIPVYFTNRALMKWVQPRQSFGRFAIYLVAMLAIAFGYPLLIGWIYFKYVWAVK